MQMNITTCGVLGSVYVCLKNVHTRGSEPAERLVAVVPEETDLGPRDKSGRLVTETLLYFLYFVPCAAVDY